MTSRRRSRHEPAWPLAIVLGVVGGGIGLITLFSRDPDRAGGDLFDDPASAEADGLPTPEDRIRVEVLNAGGVQGAAAEATERLRGAGFDVVYFGNAPARSPEGTIVLDRTGKEEAAESIADFLGSSEVREESDSTRLVDVTVLVGVDWPLGQESGDASSAALEDLGAAGDAPAWWDVRRFFSRGR